jgi:hypothetical protein
MDFVHRPVFKQLENTAFRKLDLFLSSVEGETPTVLGLLEGANLNHWIQQGRCFPFHVRMETDTVS